MRPIRFRLREILESHDTVENMRHLSELIDKDHQTVLYWNQGRAIPDLQTTMALLGILGVTLEELVVTNPFI